MSRYYAVISESNGEIVQTMMQSYRFANFDEYGEGCFVIDITNAQNRENFYGRYYWTGTEFTVLPERPEGEYKFESGQWVFDAELFGQILRADRDIKLAECDWTQMPDGPLSDAQKADWATYRQALRDLPANIPSDTHSVRNVVWPTPPA